MIHSTRRFVSSLVLRYFFLVFFSPRLGNVCSICVCLVFSVFSSSWCLGRAAACEYGTPWTFLLPFLLQKVHRSDQLFCSEFNFRVNI